MLLRPKTQLSVWILSAMSWLSAVFLGLALNAMDDDLLVLGLPLIAVFLLLPLAFIGTWAASDPEVASWDRRRMILYWIVVPGATVSTLVIVAPLAALLLLSQGVALTMLTGIWLMRRGGWKALPAGRPAE